MINANSREYLPTMSSNSVDLILTDPPYDFDVDERKFFHSEFMRISRTGAIVFCPPENLWALPADQYLFWLKPISTKNTSKRYSRFMEMILLYGDLKWVTGRHWSQYTNVFTDIVDDSRLHPYRKPPSLIGRLILNHTVVDDIILDPFAGSGVVEEVGVRLHRNVIALEIEKESCKIADLRIKHWIKEK